MDDNKSGDKRRRGRYRMSIEMRMEIIKRVAYIGLGFSILGAVFDLADYLWFSGPWQSLASTCLSLLTAWMSWRALQVSREGTYEGCDRAGYWMLAAAFISFTVGKLLWETGPATDLIVGVVLPIAVGVAVMPRRWYLGLLVVLLNATFYGLWLQSQPALRLAYPVRHTWVDWLALSFPALLIVWVAVGVYGKLTSIRTKLIIISIALVVMPSLLILVGEVLIGFRAGRERAIAQLDSVATLKEAEIESRLYSLNNELTALVSGENLRYSRVVLRGDAHVEGELYAQAVTALQTAFADTVRREREVERIFLLNGDGRVIVSTEADQVGRNYKGYTFFNLGLKGPSANLTWDAGRWWVDIMTPVADRDGSVLGVLDLRTDLSVMTEVMTRRTSGLGDTGETYIITAQRAPLTPLRAVERLPYLPDRPPYSNLVTERRDFNGIYVNYAGGRVVGVYHWIDSLNAALVAEQSLMEAHQVAYSMIAVNGVVTLGAIAVAVLVALIATRGIASPLNELAQASSQVAAGELGLRIEMERGDEIGILARAFNEMTDRLRQTIDGLEREVAERTQELALRSRYLEASAKVGRAASSILDPDLLIQQVVSLIQEQFDLYYVGLFLTDERGEWAVLRAGTGEAGRKMLARGHRIRVGDGMIGWSIANAQARIALDVGEDGVRLATRELPDTRSEAALPLRSRGRVIGALTVQSDHPGAFDEDTIAVLQMMADQVAVALDNARLYSESQTALESARRAYGEMSRAAWAQLLKTRADVAYRSDDVGISPVPDLWSPEMEQALRRSEIVRGTAQDDRRVPLAVPIKVRGDVVGVLNTYKSAESGDWTGDEIALLKTIADQLGMALESARLYEEAQRRALRERLTREITDKMRRATSIEEIVRTVVDELFSVLHPSRTFVRLGADLPSSEQEE